MDREEALLLHLHGVPMYDHNDISTHVWLSSHILQKLINFLCHGQEDLVIISLFFYSCILIFLDLLNLGINLDLFNPIVNWENQTLHLA